MGMTQGDPSPLTTQLVWREVASLKELLTSRLDDMEKAIRVAHDDLVRVPTDVQKQVATLKELHEQKICAIQKDIKALEEMMPVLNRLGTEVAQLGVAIASHKELYTGSKQEAKDAVQYALAAAKESVAEQNKSSAMAISKSETAFSKQIEGLTTLLGTTANAIEGKVGDLKDRLTQMESKVEGAKESKTDSRDTGKYGLAIAGGVIALIALAVSIAAVVSRSN